MNKYEKAANELFEHIPQAGGADCQTTNRISAMCEAYKLLIEASDEVGCGVPFDSGFAPPGYVASPAISVADPCIDCCFHNDDSNYGNCPKIDGRWLMCHEDVRLDRQNAIFIKEEK